MEASAVAAPAVVRRPARLLRLASDEQLVALVRGGDERAFEAIYDRHHAAILGFCRHMLGSREEAEDVVQHTFLAAFRDLAASGKPIELRPWLFTIARNRCLSLLRARRPQVPLELAEPATEGLAATVERREDLRELLGDLAGLPEEQRAALLLSELAALDHAGVAAVLGCPREKVKALVFQARSSLAASREARATPCEQIRRELATATGGALRRGPLRRHVRACEACRAFKAEVALQRKLLALALPVVPSAALKAGVLGAAGGQHTVPAAGAGVAALGAASGATSGTLGGVAWTGAAKLVVALALAGAVAAGGGAMAIRHAGGAAGPLAGRVRQVQISSGQPARGTRAMDPFAARGGAGEHSTAGAPIAGLGTESSRGADAQPAVPSSAATGVRTVAATGGGAGVQAVPGSGGSSAQGGAGNGPAGAGVRPGASATAPGHQPGKAQRGGQAPPGQSRTPPGQAQTPPGQSRTPPGQAQTPPGQSSTPPGQAQTPPGQSSTPRAQAKTPPGQDQTPPGQGEPRSGRRAAPRGHGD
jgi:RNA polymerase sigma factor (sigma-70 family)